jgi:hypothetical protein
MFRLSPQPDFAMPFLSRRKLSYPAFFKLQVTTSISFFLSPSNNITIIPECIRPLSPNLKLCRLTSVRWH